MLASCFVLRLAREAKLCQMECRSDPTIVSFSLDACRPKCVWSFDRFARLVCSFDIARRLSSKIHCQQHSGPGLGIGFSLSTSQGLRLGPSPGLRPCLGQSRSRGLGMSLGDANNVFRSTSVERNRNYTPSDQSDQNSKRISLDMRRARAKPWWGRIDTPFGTILLFS